MIRCIISREHTSYKHMSWERPSCFGKEMVSIASILLVGWMCSFGAPVQPDESVRQSELQEAKNLFKAAIRHADTGDYQQAHAQLAKAKAILKRHQKEKSVEYIAVVNASGVVSLRKGSLHDAERTFREAFKLATVLKPAAGRLSQDCILNLAVVLSLKGLYSESQAFFDDLHRVQKKEMGDSLEYAITLKEKASHYLRTGNCSKADECIVNCERIALKHLHKDDPFFALLSLEKARLYLNKRDYRTASELLERAMVTMRLVLNERHPVYAEFLSELGEAYRLSGKTVLSQSCLAQSIKVTKATLGTSNPLYAQNLERIGRLALTQGKNSDAELVLKEALQIREACLSPTSLEFATSLELYAECLRHLSRESEAAEFLKRAKDISLLNKDVGRPVRKP